MLSATRLSFIFVAGALAVNQDLFAPAFPVVAYELAVAPDATTYLVACPAGSDPKNCNFVQPYTLVQGPKTFEFTMSVPDEGATTLGCELEDKTSMSCAATGPASNNPKETIVASNTITGHDAETHFRAISIVTATADLLTYPAVPTTTSAPPSTSHSSSTLNSTTSIAPTASANKTTAYPTITSAPPSGTAPSYNTSAPSGSLPATTSPAPSTIPNAGMLSANSNLGGVIGVVAAVGAFFLAGAL